MLRQRQLDLLSLPAAEDERFEYKSSITPLSSLKEKIARAASGFWNSGGGNLVVGVDDSGKPDGGLPSTIGRATIRDWIDQKLQEVSPAGDYSVQLFPHDRASSVNIAADHCVVAIEFEKSARAPHMAPDHKYYIRAGAHTVPATHYLVEALWARRRIQRPQLAHTMRLKPDASEIIQLAVLSLTEEPAVNVVLTLNPLPEMWKDSTAVFPLRIPLLDRTTPFHLDVTTYFSASARLGQAVELRVEYEDLGKNRYDYVATLDVKSIPPWRMGTPATEEMARALKSIDSTLKAVPKAIEALQSELSEMRSGLEVIRSATLPQKNLERAKLEKTISDDAKSILLAARESGTIIFSPYLGGSQLHAGRTQFISKADNAREEAKWNSCLIELRDNCLVDGAFNRGSSSIFKVTNFGYEIADSIAQMTNMSKG